MHILLSLSLQKNTSTAQWLFFPCSTSYRYIISFISSGMLALSPLTTSTADHDQRIDAAGGFSDPLLQDEVDFLDSIDFTGIFDGCGLDAIADLPELQLSADILEHSSPGGEDQQASVPRERLKEKAVISAPSPGSSRGRKPEAAVAAKSSHGKTKVKVDWTPELHRRFVQAVEQLGVDKAVPSRILELMGINNLTRHNVASHLQKYRSHWKHLLGREAEAAAWSCGRQLHRVRPKKENSSSWISPTLGFTWLPPFRPLHVWGHPTVDHRPPLLPAMWPGNGMPLQFQAPQWPPQPPNYIAYWQPHYKEGSREGWGPTAALQPLPALVTGIPPHAMYRPPHWVPPLQQHPGLQTEFSVYPSKESIDAAIEDVLAKPWLPLPLGLKAPSTESVLGELQRQGVSKVPPSASSNSKGK